MQYSLDQYTLIPKALSSINSRSEINVYNEHGKLPIFVSPMTCILDKNNFDKFLASAFMPIYPIWAGDLVQKRLELSATRNCWVSLSLREFYYTFCVYNEDYVGPDSDDKHYRILIDCADGHLAKIYELVRDVKSKYSNLEIMVGNIANPETYLECCKAGVDYVRVGIGGGSGCTTSVQTGFHAGMGWLLTEIQRLKKELCYSEDVSATINPTFEEICKERGWNVTKVIADGGINTFSKAVKALALGADYVMMGKIFAQCQEACGMIMIGDGEKHPEFFRKYYGQASEQGQIDRFGKAKSNPEGTELFVPVEWSLESLKDKFDGVFKSALSYGGSHNFDEFIGKVRYDLISDSEFKAYDK